MTIDVYRGLVRERQHVRDAYAALNDRCDVCVTLSAIAEAPVGLESTGDPIFAVPASLLGVPSLSLPVLQIGGLPLGLQLIGFANEDASMFAAASRILTLFDK
jgi:Asp-tRNA(Asn)/Glu-tRNA(Gln) amidotransferase A subunit family amidase